MAVKVMFESRTAGPLLLKSTLNLLPEEKDNDEIGITDVMVI